MKTKLTLLIIAIAAFVGVGMLMAFKTVETGHYVVVSVSHTNGYLVVSDESTQTEIQLKSAIASNQEKIGANNKIIAKTFNELYNKGYKLKSSVGGDLYTNHIFEKQ